MGFGRVLLAGGTACPTFLAHLGQRRGGNILAYMMRAILILLAGCRCAFAMNPSLDISQYAHTAWMVRDGDGYLWLGTEFGLVRFDGVRSVSCARLQR
jgi:hypothetical protein